MDVASKRRLLLAFISNTLSRLASTIIQLVQVPIFLHFWGVATYGEWLVVSAIPSYLAFSGMGYGDATANEMSMLVTRGQRHEANRVFCSSWWFVWTAGTIALVAFAVLLFLTPFMGLLNLSAIEPDDVRWILLFLGIGTLLGQLEQIVQAAFRSNGQYAYGSFAKSMISLIAFGCMIIPVLLGQSPRAAAFTFAVANFAGTILLCQLLRRHAVWISFGLGEARLEDVRRLLRPALAFFALPIGNALNLQGTILAVGYAMGPTAVVVFGTTRTVSRIALQIVQLVGLSYWSEMSVAFTRKDDSLILKMHRQACQIALWLAITVVGGVALVGPRFLHAWTTGILPPDRGLLVALLAAVVIYTTWSTSSTLLVATGRHQRFALFYLAMTVVGCILSYQLTCRFGLYGAAASLILSELAMCAYVLRASLRIAQDRFWPFAASMLQWPPGFHWKRLRARRARGRGRLNRSKP